MRSTAEAARDRSPHRSRQAVVSAPSYRLLLTGAVTLLEQARRAAARSINTVMTTTYWEIGRRIVEHEQGGRDKPEYGEQILDKLSGDLTSRLGRGFSRRNVFHMRQFYLTYREKVQTLSAQSSRAASAQKVQTLSAQFIPQFPLSWSHYIRLMQTECDAAREFYARETLRGGWSVRELDRQIASQFYERAERSRRPPQGTQVCALENEIRDPLVLEFLNLKDEYSESDLEEALIVELQRFLVELGNDFAFVARQKRLRIGNEWFRVDLVFFHRRLRCPVLIELKTGRFHYSDVGQMNMYLNYAREHWTNEGENPPVGLVLCSEKDEAVARYAMDGLANGMMAAQYRTMLPAERQMMQELRRTRKRLLAAPPKRR